MITKYKIVLNNTSTVDRIDAGKVYLLGVLSSTMTGADLNALTLELTEDEYEVVPVQVDAAWK